jgi:creatinine amidohydrolase
VPSEPILAKPILWEWLTWEEIRALRASGMDMAILPVGSTEQHGPHLSVNVDTLCADTLARAVSAVTGVPVLPALPYGAAWGHTSHWPGTLSLSPATVTQTVVEIGEWLLEASGFTRLLILNGHVTNFAPLRIALETLRYRSPEMRIALRNVWEASPRVQAAYTADAQDWHANAAETSLMLAHHRRGVRPDKIADDPDRTGNLFFSYPVPSTSRNGATGLPTRATVEQGVELLAWATEDLSAQVRAALTEEPPFTPILGEISQKVYDDQVHKRTN